MEANLLLKVAFICFLERLWKEANVNWMQSEMIKRSIFRKVLQMSLEIKPLSCRIKVSKAVTKRKVLILKNFSPFVQVFSIVPPTQL
jgi:hypothetical protein